MKHLTLHCLASSLSTLNKSMQELPLNRAKHICEGKDAKVCGFATESTEITNFLGNCQWNSPLPRFYALIFFC
jgi:hypothetical protein